MLQRERRIRWFLNRSSIRNSSSDSQTEFAMRQIQRTGNSGFEVIAFRRQKIQVSKKSTFVRCGRLLLVQKFLACIIRKATKDKMTVTVMTLVICGYLSWYANRTYRRTHSAIAKSKRARWAGAFVGSAIGSFFGIAGFGSAIAGTIPGAICGYLLGYYVSEAFRTEDASLEHEALGEAGRHAAHVTRQTLHVSRELKYLIWPRALLILKRIMGWGLAGTVVLLLLNVNWSVVQERMGEGNLLANQVAARTPTPSAAQVREMIGTPVVQSDASFEVLVRKLEIAHPELDPNHILFDRQTVARILEIKAIKEAEGLSALEALDLAAAEYYGPSRPALIQNRSNVNTPTSGYLPLAKDRETHSMD